MKLNATDHIYRCKPDVLGNEYSDDPFFVLLKGISQNDFDEQVLRDVTVKMEHTPEEALKITSASTQKFIADRVAGFENLEIGGKEIKTFDECRAVAPRELTNWIIQAVYSTAVLMESEVKN